MVENGFWVLYNTFSITIKSELQELVPVKDSERDCLVTKLIIASYLASVAYSDYNVDIR